MVQSSRYRTGSGYRPCRGSIRYVCPIVLAKHGRRFCFFHLIVIDNSIQPAWSVRLSSWNDFEISFVLPYPYFICFCQLTFLTQFNNDWFFF